MQKPPKYDLRKDKEEGGAFIRINTVHSMSLTSVLIGLDIQIMTYHGAFTWMGTDDLQRPSDYFCQTAQQLWLNLINSSVWQYLGKF